MNRRLRGHLGFPPDSVASTAPAAVYRGAMTTTLEREIKLPFASTDDARAAILAAGATPFRCRRLQEDSLLDTPDGRLRTRGSVLRVRMECGKSLITLKGPVQPSAMKLREELETLGGDGPLLVRIFEELGFQVWFRYEKYREEFTFEDVIIALDETPIGVFVEVEGSERGITAMAESLGRRQKDFVLDSYRALFTRHCAQQRLPVGDMLF
jgi:adenylate cyclase, class 2